jgi:hypothetical protein
MVFRRMGELQHGMDVGNDARLGRARMGGQDEIGSAGAKVGQLDTY